LIEWKYSDSRAVICKYTVMVGIAVSVSIRSAVV